MKIKRILLLVLCFCVLLSVSAFADFSTTDSSNLATVKTKTTSILSYLTTYLPDITTIKTNTASMSPNVSAIKIAVNSMGDVLGNTSDSAGTASVMGQLKKIGNSLGARGEQQSGIIDQIQAIRVAIGARGPSQSGIIDYVSATYEDLHDNIHPIKLKLDVIYNLLYQDKEKEMDASDAYSGNGGYDVSSSSSQLGSVSGSVTGNLDSGVSMSSALNAVETNESDFEYFFFDMAPDLDTSGGGSKVALKSAPRVSNGQEVPDFLSDYWAGLSEVKNNG